MHFLTTAAEIASAAPMQVDNNGGGAAPGFTGTLLSNGRNIAIGVIVVLLLVASAFGIAVGALKGNFRKSIVIVLASVVSLIPAGIVLGIGFVAVATGVVNVGGF